MLVGTVLFNVNTFHALQTGLDANSYDRLVWAPDAIGSACFLVGAGLLLPESAAARAREPRGPLVTNEAQV